MKITIVTIVILSALYGGWKNRLDLLLTVAPTLKNLKDPIGVNQDYEFKKGPTTAKLPPSERPPNIVLVLIDDMGFNDISLYNGGAADGSLQTPNIDALAQQGVRFNNGYAANAVCAPSRASLMTGRYSTRFGFEHTPIYKIGPTIFSWMEELDPQPLPAIVNKELAETLPPMKELGMPPSEITMAEALKDKGYYTAHIGKWHLGSVGDMRPEKQGFDDSLYMVGPLYLPVDDPNVVNGKIEDSPIDNMVWSMGQYAVSFNNSDPFAPNDYLTDYFTDAAVKVIENHKHDPFFLFMSHWGIHNPLQARKEDYAALAHIKDHNLRIYGAMIRAIDRSVAKITQALEKNGLSDNTLIVFTSDNGGAAYINFADINKPYRGWKLTHFEGGMHVPYIFKWPAQLQAGSTSNHAIQHVDLMPTFTALAGGSMPTDRVIDGVNLLPHLADKNGDVANTGAPHKTLYWLQGHQETVLHEGWKLIRAAQPNKGQDALPKQYLFNLNIDPTEQINLASIQTEKVAQLSHMLDAHRAEQSPPAWPSVFEAPILIDKPGLISNYKEGDDYLYWPN